MKHLLKSLAEFQQEVKVIHKATQGYGKKNNVIFVYIR
jgi:hypothetical protein